MIYLIIILWIISPLVLIPLTIHYKSYKSKYLKENYTVNNLKNLINSLIMKGLLNENEKELYCKYIGCIYNKAPPTKNQDTNSSQKDINNVETISHDDSLKNLITNNTIINHDVNQNIEPPEKVQLKQQVHYEETSPLLSNDNDVYLNEPIKVKKSSNISTISIILIIGVVFVLVAGIIFTTTTWNSLNNVVRTVLIFSASILFFIVGNVSEKKLKLEKTGMAFFSIGCFLLPVDIFTIGVFELFGSWLSWSGDGKFLLSAIGSLLLAIASYNGTKKYISKFYSFVFLSGISGSIVLILKSIFASVDNSIFNICIPIYLMMILLLEGKIKNVLASIQDVCLSVWQTFSATNILILSCICLLTSHMGIISGLSMILFFVFFTYYANKSLNNSYIDEYTHIYIHLCGSLIFLITGLIQIFEIQHYFLIVTIMILAFTIIQELPLLQDNCKNFFSAINLILFILGLILCPFNLPSWIYILIIIICATWIYIKQDMKCALYIQSLYAIALISKVSILLTDNMQISILLISCFMLCVFLIYRFVNILKNQVSLIVYTSLMGLLLLLSFTFSLDYKLIIGIIWFAMLIINLIHNDNISNCSRYVLPLSIIAIIHSIDFGYSNIMYILVISILLITSVFFNFKNIKNLQNIFNVYFFIMGYIYSLISFLNNDEILKLYLGLLLVFSIFKIVVSTINKLDIEKVVYTSISFLNLVLFSLSIEGLSRLILVIGLWILSIILNLKNMKSFQRTSDIYVLVVGYIYSLISFVNNDEILKLYLGLLLAFSIFKIVVSKMNKLDIEKVVYTNISFVNMILFVFSLEMLSSINKMFILSIIFLTTYYAIKKFNLDDDILKIMKFYTIAILEVSQWYICLSNGHFTISLIIIIMSFLFSYNFRNNILIVFSIFNLYYVLNNLVINDLITSNVNNRIAVFNIIFYIAMFVLGRYLHKSFLIRDKETKKYYLDYFTIFSIVPIFRFLTLSLYFDTYKLNLFIMFILLSIYPMFYYNRVLVTNGKQILLTLSNICLCFVFWSQPFLIIPQILFTEWNCIPLIVSSIMISIIWKQYTKIKEHLPFSMTLLTSIILSISAIISQEIIDAFILLFSLIIILIISFAIKRKKWFCFSTVELICLTLYLTRNFWASISWWIYLLIVGLLMIAIGATNEYLKIKNENLKDNLKASTKRMFQDWKW